jgi:nucleoid DNA-binding protein
MDELVDLVVKKTGIPAATAKTIITVVINYLKKKLPAPVGVQIDGLLGKAGTVKAAQDVLGKIGSLSGKKK